MNVKTIAAVILAVATWYFLFFAIGISIGGVWPDYRAAARLMMQEDNLTGFTTPMLFANFGLFAAAGLAAGAVATFVARKTGPALVVGALFLAVMIYNHYVRVWDQMPAWYNLVVPFVIGGAIVIGGRLSAKRA